MILCLDIGNTYIHGGVFSGEVIILRFHYPTTEACTCDTLGTFLKDVLDKNQLDSSQVEAISLCSVVPSLNYVVIAACKQYFNINPLVLKPGIKTGIQLSVQNPLEMGADRIANAVAAVHHFPGRHVIVVDFGTATTVCAISQDKAHLGGAILPGLKLCMDSLAHNTAQLTEVDICTPEKALGKSSLTNLQSGLYHGQFGAVQTLVDRISQEAFAGDSFVLIATGGYSDLYTSENFFDMQVPDLVLHGLRLIWDKNQ